jgi:hypothetical protein
MAAINNANIKPLIPQNIEVTPNKNVAATPKPELKTAAVVPTDRIEISRLAKTVNKAVKVLDELPEVRQALVQKAETDKVEKTANVPAQLMAQKMLFQDNIK